MPREFGERPYHEPTSQRNTHQEAEHAAHTPLSPLMQRDETRGERSHAEMVAMIKRDMAAYIAEKDLDIKRFNPVQWMRDQLCLEIAKQSVRENNGQIVDAAAVPHANLQLAWEVISFPYITRDIYRSNVEHGIKSKSRTLGQTITLDHNESRLLEAMAEACGIPLTYGHVTIEHTQQTFDIQKKDAAP
jgi:hypothetical protein